MKLINKAALCLGLLFLACAISVFAFDDGKNGIYNNDNKIAGQSDNCIFESKIDARTSSNEINIKYSGFTGMNTIWILEVKEDSEISFNFDSTVDMGEFKVVSVSTKKEIENLLEGIGEENKTIKLAKGKYTIKLVGRKATGKIKLSINKSQKVNIIRVEN